MPRTLPPLFCFKAAARSSSLQGQNAWVQFRVRNLVERLQFGCDFRYLAGLSTRLECGFRPCQTGSVTAITEIVPDSERRGFIGALPPAVRPFASLMRLD